MKKKDTGKKTSATKKESVAAGQSQIFSSSNFLLLLPALLPLLFSDKAVDVTVPVRYFFLSLFLFVYLLVFFIIRRQKINWTFSPLVNLVFSAGLCFSVWQLIGISSAVNHQVVYYEAGLHLLLLVLLFVLVQNFKSNEKNILNFSKALVVLSLLSSFIGFCQLYKLGFDSIPGHSSPYALNANGNFFGSAQMLLLPFVLYVWYASDKAWRYVAACAVAGILISVISSKTRAAWLATVAVVSVSVLLTVVFVPAERRRWLRTAATIAVAIPVLAIMLMFTSPGNDLAKAIKQRTRTTTLTTDTSNSAARTINDRLVIWEKTVAVIKNHPITGAGAGNWKLVVPTYGTEGTAWQDASYVPDHVHNIYLQAAAETGLPGALLYFTVFALIVSIGFKTITADAPVQKKILSILMLAGISGFMLDGLFSFANQRIEHLLYLNAMFAILISVYLNTSGNTNQTLSVHPALALALAAIALCNLGIGYQKYTFEKQLNRVRAYEKNKNYNKVISEGKLGKNSLVNIDEVGTSIESHTALAYKNLKDYPTALAEIRKAESINPGNSKVYNSMGTIYTDMGKFDSAVICYTRALQLSGKMEVALKNLTVNYYQLKNYKAALQTMQRWNNANDQFFTDLKAECERQLQLQN